MYVAVRNYLAVEECSQVRNDCNRASIQKGHLSAHEKITKCFSEIYFSRGIFFNFLVFYGLPTVRFPVFLLYEVMWVRVSDG